MEHYIKLCALFLVVYDIVLILSGAKDLLLPRAKNARVPHSLSFRSAAEESASCPLLIQIVIPTVSIAKGKDLLFSLPSS
jgi:hypothetical protein